MWWHSHVPVIIMQIAAIFAYVVGSRRFYLRQDKFMAWLAAGILLDIGMALTPLLIGLPRMQADQGAPWSSALFIAHVAGAVTGMLGFIAMFLYLWANGCRKPYPRLRRFQYFVLLPLWLAGVTISLVNFAAKVLYGVRLYDM